jgi:hypothetical protein
VPIESGWASGADCNRLAAYEVAWLHHDKLFRLQALDNFDAIF